MNRSIIIIFFFFTIITMITVLGINVTQADVLFNRGLPIYNSETPNINLIAGVNRCNAADNWTSSEPNITEYQIGGDDFTIGSTGELYDIDVVRVWIVFGKLEHVETPPAMNSPFAMELWGGPEGGSIELISSTYSTLNVSYPNTVNEQYQRVGDDEYRNIWQIDFSVDQYIEGGQKYYFFINGYWLSTYDYLYKSHSVHTSNAALSNSTQQGADDTFLWLDISWDGSQWIPGAITEQNSINIYGTSKGVDANIQIFGTQYSIIPVTNNSGAFDVAPQILDDGHILWQGWDGQDYEIYYQAPSQDPTQLTDNNSPDVMPQMNASGDLVWMNWDNSDWEVCYDFGEGLNQVTSNAGAFDVLPQITDDGQVYWQGWDGQDYEIYHFNSATGATAQLTDNSLPDAAPQVNASGQLTWMHHDGQDWEVWYDTGSGSVQLTNNSGQDLEPQITPEGEIYWQGWDGSDYEIFRYTIGSGLTENLTDNIVNDYSPAVNNGVLVWSQYDGQDWEIYRMNLETGFSHPITDNNDNDERPKINGASMIVWQKWDGSDYEVYAYK